MEIQRETNEIRTDSTPVPKIEAMATTKKANRRFKQPKKLVVSATKDDFVMKNGGKKDKKEKTKDDIDGLAHKEIENLTPQAKRLSNFLAASSSHNWIWYEFGNSFVDLSIQRGNCDMNSYMKEYYPQLKIRLLPRRFWQLLRRNLGKARRFSAAFISLELEKVQHSRYFVRQLQQANPIVRDDHPFLFQIHKGIALPLARNAKVSTLLPGKGVVSGVVASIHPRDSAYRVKCVLKGKKAVFRIPDYIIQSAENFVGLPIAHLLNSIDPNEEIFKMQIPMGKGYNRKLLQAFVQLNKLVAIKKKVVQEIAEKIDNFEKTPNRKKNLSSTLECNILALFGLNEDVLGPMSVLNEYLDKYFQFEKVLVANACTALERYLKCCHQAELDVKNADKYNSLNLQSALTRTLVKDLQTIMYLSGETDSQNGDGIMFVLDNLIAHMQKALPPALRTGIDEMREILKPFLQHLLEKSRKYLGHLSIEDVESDV